MVRHRRVCAMASQQTYRRLVHCRRNASSAGQFARPHAPASHPIGGVLREMVEAKRVYAVLAVPSVPRNPYARVAEAQGEGGPLQDRRGPQTRLSSSGPWACRIVATWTAGCTKCPPLWRIGPSVYSSLWLRSHGAVAWLREEGALNAAGGHGAGEEQETQLGGFR